MDTTTTNQMTPFEKICAAADAAAEARRAAAPVDHPTTAAEYAAAARELRSTYELELEAAQGRDDDHCEE